MPKRQPDKMTIGQLRRMKAGHSILRFTMVTEKGGEKKVLYWLGKRQNSTYFISLSCDGSMKSKDAKEWEMLDMINNASVSARAARALYLSKR